MDGGTISHNRLKTPMSHSSYQSNSSEEVKKKVKVFTYIAIFCFVTLLMRVWYLQIIKGNEFTELSEKNRVRRTLLAPKRGTIRDRNGEILVSVRPSFNVYLTPEDVPDLKKTLGDLSRFIEIDRDAVLKKVKGVPSFKNVLVKHDISRKEVAQVEENNLYLPGIKVIVEPLRFYVHGESSAHILGYLGEVSKDHLKKPEYADYQQGDLVGKGGLESILEPYLRGGKGAKEVEVDVTGRELKVLKSLPSQTGNHVTLTLDFRLQKALEDYMKAKDDGPFAGSAVVLKVDTGEVLAIASKPSYDPNLFSAGISAKDWKRLINAQSHPLQNKAIDGQYPPGSTYKIITAYAGLQEKLITTEDRVYCPGFYKLGRGRYRCWKRGGHGYMNVHDALVQSCDVFFYSVGNRLGIDTLAKYGRLFGLGSPTGIQLLGEKAGLVPTSSWKEKLKKEQWYPGETISASIGQGYNLVTPLQQVIMMATVVNGGKRFRPMLVKSIHDNSGKVVNKFQPELLKDPEFNQKNLKIIREALLGVVNEKKGTAWRARMKSIKVSGKTGTAQVVRLKSASEYPDKKVPYKFRDHAWFVASAPYEKPEIAVAVIVEHGGHGGAVAAPIAKKAIQKYFKLYPLPEPDGTEAKADSQTPPKVEPNSPPKEL